LKKQTILKGSVIGALATGVLLAGCSTTPFFVPITDQERQQVAALRAFRTAVSPQSNRAMGLFQRDIMSVLALQLPTEYGADLAPYLLPLPKIAVPAAPAGYLANIDTAKQLLGYLVPNQMVVTALATSAEQGKQANWQYNLLLQPTPLGQAGSLQVTTSSSQWLSNISAGTSTKAYYFGQKFTRYPDSVQATGELTLQGNAGKASFNASLSSFEPDPLGSDLMIPQSVSFSGSVPGLSWNLNGKMTTKTALTIQGTITVQGKQGGESYMVDGASVNGDLTLRLLNEEKAIDLNLYLLAGKLKGQAKSRIDRRYPLAEIVSSKDGKVKITYGDGSAEVLF